MSDRKSNMSSYVHGQPGSQTEIMQMQDMSSSAIDDSAEGTVVDGSDLQRRNTFDDQELAELGHIAATISRRRSVASAAHGRSFSSPTDKAMDPNSTSFELEKWLRHFIQETQAGGLEKTPVGFTFQNLNVSGSGQALQLQETLTDLFLTPFRLKESFGSNKTHRKILHSFDANAKPGELLVVLGRPGSGCSTFLKSVTGELHGLEIEDPSSIRYSGISQKQMVKEFGGELVYNQEVGLLCG